MGKREAYIESLKIEIDTWNAELDQLTAKFREVRVEAGPARDDEEQMQAIRRRRDEAMAKLMRIESAYDDPREDLKQGIEYIWSVLKIGFGKVVSRFK